ncbi:hypothetical protein ACH4ND_11925 [Streptomyces sp. NPDC017179]|uniref:hypothetical protein n=1 Tax=Streptomyces sp. NPDC017179 TaxID=3364979 RepID=UPI0037B844AB
MTEQTRQPEQKTEPTAGLVPPQDRPDDGRPALSVPSVPPVPSAPPKDRRALRAVLRWTAAVVVFAAVGAGTGYGITHMERGDLPGLATESDGRWEYPTLAGPPLPSGSPGPFELDNRAGAHHADLRALLLPAPKGATEDKALRGTDGWLATKDFLEEYESKADRSKCGKQLKEHGLRHIAARGWTTQDGTHTRIYLLQFHTASLVDHLVGRWLAASGGPAFQVRGAPVSVYDEEFPPRAEIDGIVYSVYAEAKPYGAEQVRQAYLSAGDTLAVVLQTRKGTAPAVPFQQTVILQSELLA